MPARSGPGKAAEARARGDLTEQPVPAIALEQVGHQAPGDGDDEQVDDRIPDIESAPDPAIVRVQRQTGGEAGHDEGREEVEGREQPPARHARRDPAVERHDRERRDERAGEQPGQILAAADTAECLAHRPQHEEGGEEEKEEKAAAGDRRQFLAARGEQASGESPRRLRGHRYIAPSGSASPRPAAGPAPRPDCRRHSGSAPCPGSRSDSTGARPHI